MLFRSIGVVRKIGNRIGNYRIDTLDIVESGVEYNDKASFIEDVYKRQGGDDGEFFG